MAEILSLEGFRFRDGDAHSKISKLEAIQKHNEERFEILETSHRYFTPQMFGAIADGVHDCTEAVQAAINAAQAGVNGVNTVYLPCGVYLCGELTIDNLYGVRIYGERNSKENGTIFLYKGKDFLFTVRHHDSARQWIYLVSMSEFAVLFKQNAEGAFNFKNLQESALYDISVWGQPYDIKYGMFFDSVAITDVTRCTFSWCKNAIAIDTDEYYTENPQDTGNFNVQMCNFYKGDIAVQIQSAPFGVSVYNNWMEEFEHFFYLSNSTQNLTVFQLNIHNNVFCSGSIATGDMFYFESVASQYRAHCYFSIDSNLVYFTTPRQEAIVFYCPVSSRLRGTISNNTIIGVESNAIRVEAYNTDIVSENNVCLPTWQSTTNAPEKGVYKYAKEFVLKNNETLLITKDAILTMAVAYNGASSHRVIIAGNNFAESVNNCAVIQYLVTFADGVATFGKIGEAPISLEQNNVTIGYIGVGSCTVKYI